LYADAFFSANFRISSSHFEQQPHDEPQDEFGPVSFRIHHASPAAARLIIKMTIICDIISSSLSFYKPTNLPV
jgi:hypothetical protein